MSHVTNIMITTVLDTKNLEEINKWIVKKEFASFVEMDYDKHLGNKVFEPAVFYGAFNYFPINKFLDMLGKLNYEWAEMFQIFIEDENDYCFKIYHASDLLL